MFCVTFIIGGRDDELLLALSSAVNLFSRMVLWEAGEEGVKELFQADMFT